MSFQAAGPACNCLLNVNVDFLTVTVFSLAGLVMTLALLRLTDTDLIFLMFAG